MQDILGESLKVLKKIRVRRTRMFTILLILSLIVSVNVCWAMRQPGLTLAGDGDCGIVEHTHDEDCQTAEMPCELPEHVHSVECYADNTADVETPLDWQNMFAAYPYTGNLRQDLVGIAKTQVGYTESAQNFEIDSDRIQRGYTRYGAWYGAPYSDWSAMFVSFCLHYAGADPEEYPGNTGANSMAEHWKKLDKYALADSYVPVSGDLVFLTENRVGIVAEVQNATIYVIHGDEDDAVCRETLSLDDGMILGWGLTEATISREEAATEAQEQTEPAASAEKNQTAANGDITENAVINTETSTEFQVQGELSFSEQTEEIDLLDISNGPVFLIFADKSAEIQMQRFAAMSARTAKDLITYLNKNGGSYSFVLLNLNNEELPKDADGKYIVQADTGYKLTLRIASPNGILPGTYCYQLPDGVTVDGGDGTFVLDGTEVGTWDVTDDGMITLVFNQNINNKTGIEIPATMGIRFSEQEGSIDFDGKITVTVEKPPEQENPTQLNKWAVQGNETNGVAPTKLRWTLQIVGNEDSDILGSVLTDQLLYGEWSKEHRFTASDIADGLTFGAAQIDPATGAEIAWHSWHVAADDPNLTWTETGWSYQMPENATCQWCGPLALGNDNWTYTVSYTSTPDPTGTAGTFGYENEARIDGQYAYAWAQFTHGEIHGVITKAGAFHGDAGGGSFLWEFQVMIPGMREGQKADYCWYIMDYMDLRDSDDSLLEYITNDSNNATVTADYNGTTIQIPSIQNATDNDPFAWHAYWSADHNDGIYYGRQLNLLCRCNCTEENCPVWGDGKCGSEYWYEADDGQWYTNGFCQCWTAEENTTFTFAYETKDLSIVEKHGGLGRELRNDAQLYNRPNGSPTDYVLISSSQASVPIPGLFKKELTQEFDGYTAHYQITVNEGKLVLTNGSPLNIHDEMTQTLAYIGGSLVITTEDTNGNTAILQHGEDYTVTYDGTGTKTDANGQPVHVMDIVILNPQPVMYILDYDTTLIVPAETTSSVKYSNSATITLWGEDFSDSSGEKHYADFSISAQSYKVGIFKTGAETAKPLKGAIFGLFNEKGGLITSDETVDDGTILFETNITEGIILREHLLYYIQELKAPPGYQLDETKRWFCFCDKADDSCATCDQVMAGTDAFRIPHEDDKRIHVQNVQLHYNLPSTGGPGVYPLILVSVVFVVTPLVYGFIKRRRQERRGVG